MSLTLSNNYTFYHLLTLISTKGKIPKPMTLHSLTQIHLQEHLSTLVEPNLKLKPGPPSAPKRPKNDRPSNQIRPKSLKAAEITALRVQNEQI